MKISNKRTNYFKVLFIPYEKLLLLIAGKLKITNIPEDATIFAAENTIMKKGFNILIEHPTFPEVEIGVIPSQFYAVFEETPKQ